MKKAAKKSVAKSAKKKAVVKKKQVKKKPVTQKSAKKASAKKTKKAAKRVKKSMQALRSLAATPPDAAIYITNTDVTGNVLVASGTVSPAGTGVSASLRCKSNPGVSDHEVDANTTSGNWSLQLDITGLSCTGDVWILQVCHDGNNDVAHSMEFTIVPAAAPTVPAV